MLFGNGPSSLAVNLLMLFHGSCPVGRANATGKGGIPAGLSVRAWGLQLPFPHGEVCLQHGHPVALGSVGWSAPRHRAQPGGCCPEPGCRVWPGLALVFVGGCRLGLLVGLSSTLSASECKCTQDDKQAGEGEQSVPVEQESSPCALEASAVPLGAEPEQGCPLGTRTGLNQRC